MNKSIVLRITSVLVSVGLMIFSLVPNLPTHAQNKDTCKDLGWTPINESQVGLMGKWIGNQNRNCKPPASSWQYPGFPITVTKEGGAYYGQVGNEDKTEIDIQGSKFVWVRDVRKSAGPDNNKVHNQTWTGTLERNNDGGIRIYGTWTGAYNYLKQEDRNLDFLMIKQ